ncbi:DivIVA domain-containing protein [Streptomyces sp. NPDC048362]|uniref:DivIVA domain-containing protein n=1 Tax=Streptomyces sp. NPDC048362 TaxID=3365539 RepID=UPI0037112996
MLTHRDIMEKKFSVTRIKEGYAQDEVDDFLEILASHYKTMEAMVADLQHENGELNIARKDACSPQSARIGPTEDRIERQTTNPAKDDDRLSLDAIKTVLESAQKAAERITEQAALESEKLKSQALEKSNHLVDEAKVEAAQIIANAEAEQKTRVIELERRHAELAVSVVELEQRRKKLREWARATLESLLQEASNDGMPAVWE